MLVLDFVRETSAGNPTIVVPRFHTGHLGFVPDTMVHVGLLTPAGGRAHSEVPIRPTEVLVTPILRPQADFFLLSLVMKDRPGAVMHLVRAVSDLGVHIEIQESATIEQFADHRVDLLLNLRGSDLPRDPQTIPPRIGRLYNRIAGTIPFHDLRLLDIFDRVMAHCADIIAWTDTGLPQLTIRSLPTRDLELATPVSLVSQGGSTLIALPELIAQRLRDALRVDTTGRLAYVFVSDTHERNLRAFFLSEDVARRLIMVGFYHPDESGMLLRLLEGVAHAGFSVVTSLLRKYAKGESIWEAVLEYQDGDAPVHATKVTPQDYGQIVLPWACDKVKCAPAFATSDGAHPIRLGPPLYPRKFRKAVGGPILIADDDAESGDARRTDARPDLAARLGDMRAAVLKLDQLDKTRAMGILDMVVERHERKLKRGLFLSYPGSAARLVNSYLVSALDDRYAVRKYDQPGGEKMREAIIGLMRASDYFIGIWHPEVDEAGLPIDPVQMSPWLHFEWGVACSLGLSWALLVVWG